MHIPLLGGIPIGLLASTLAGLATGLGALPVLVHPNFSLRAKDRMLGFGAGVMLAATSFSLIIPALQHVHDAGGRPLRGALTVAGGMLLGGLFLRVVHDLLPHVHELKEGEGQGRQGLGRLRLFVMAITLHNFPEGLAVGVGFSGPELALGLPVALGIAVQNVPEGLVVAVALRGAGLSAGRSVLVSLATGLVEPLGAAVGLSALAFGTALLPWGLAFAGGAMLYVISHEIIPESHRGGFEREATGGLMWGFVLALGLDVMLG